MDYRCWEFQEQPTALIVVKDVFSGVAPGGHVVDRTIELHSQGTRHDAGRLADRIARNKT
jgi:hypothetical protein